MKVSSNRSVNRGAGKEAAGQCLMSNDECRINDEARMTNGRARAGIFGGWDRSRRATPDGARDAFVGRLSRAVLYDNCWNSGKGCA